MIRSAVGSEEEKTEFWIEPERSRITVWPQAENKEIYFIIVLKMLLNQDVSLKDQKESLFSVSAGIWCLICKQKDVVFKEYKLIGHYSTKRGAVWEVSGRRANTTSYL